MTAKIGDWGEQLVSKWLQSKSYCILHHKWRCRWGEIDLIAEDKHSSTLIFVEVKTRNDFNWDNYGLEAVSLSKQAKISKSATVFLARNYQYIDFYMRFDVAAVKYKKVHNDRQLYLDDQYKFPENHHNSVTPTEVFSSEFKNGYYLQIANYLENAFELYQE